MRKSLLLFYLGLDCLLAVFGVRRVGVRFVIITQGGRTELKIDPDAAQSWLAGVSVLVRWKKDINRIIRIEVRCGQCLPHLVFRDFVLENGRRLRVNQFCFDLLHLSLGLVVVDHYQAPRQDAHDGNGGDQEPGLKASQFVESWCLGAVHAFVFKFEARGQRPVVWDHDHLRTCIGWHFDEPLFSDFYRLGGSDGVSALEEEELGQFTLHDFDVQVRVVAWIQDGGVDFDSVGANVDLGFNI